MNTEGYLMFIDELQRFLCKHSKFVYQNYMVSFNRHQRFYFSILFRQGLDIDSCVNLLNDANKEFPEIKELVKYIKLKVK